MPEVAGVHRARRPAARPGHRAGRRAPGVGGLRPQQGQGGQRDRACGSISSACRRRRRWTSCSRSSIGSIDSDRHDGILVQSPLPDAMGRGAAQRVFDAIDPDKDVDGFNPVNVGKLVQGRAHLKPCTPSGVIEILDRSAIADRRPPRRRDRPQRDRRQADGDAAPAARRDRHDLPLEDAGSRRRRRARRHPRRGDRPAGLRHARTSSSPARR